MQGKTGAARVALLTKAPVIPVAQWGANDAMPPYAKEKKLQLFPRKTLRVQAGPPVDLSAFYDREPTAEVLRAATDVIMTAITEQLAVVRGEPAPVEPYDWRKAIARERRAAREAAKATQGAGADPIPAEPAAATEPAVGPQQARSTQQAQEDESK